MKKSNMAAALVSLLSGSAKAEKWCTGMSRIFGSEGPQKTDDQNNALEIARLIELDGDEFPFEFGLARNVELQTAENDENAIFAKSATLQVQMKNWADYLVYLSENDHESTLNSLHPQDFVWAIHGDSLHPEKVKSALNFAEVDIPEVVKFDANGYMTHVDLPIEN